MTIIKDCTKQEENATVAGILMHLRKQEERQQRLQWIVGLSILAFIISLLLIVVVK